jgi:hypothetical protein
MTENVYKKFIEETGQELRFTSWLFNKKKKEAGEGK